MKERNRKFVEDLEAAASEGVLIYQGDREVSAEDIAHMVWVREEMAYIPDFIVLDEKGQLREIWYEDGEALESRMPPVERIKEQ